jgi:hypothetical protein
VEHHLYRLEALLLEPGESISHVPHLLVAEGGSLSLGFAVTSEVEHQHAVACLGVDGCGIESTYWLDLLASRP